MKALKTYIYIATIAHVMIFFSCHKKDHLAEKPVSNFQVPGTLDDVQALLDNNLVFNESPGIGEISADNYYLMPSSWQTLSQKDQRTHIWAADIFMGTGDVADWNKPYEQIFYTNVVLQALKKIEKNAANQQRWNAIQGAAFFLRGIAYYELSQLFMLPYDNQSASTDWGLPLRLSDNVMEKSVRSSVKQTYDQIISDISAAKVLLPPTVDTAHSNRPSKPAAMALLSKIYLIMRNYDAARAYADSCLQLQNQLLDYNSLNPNSSFPFKTSNPEIIFFSQSSTNSTLMAVIARGTIIDSGLYNSYDANDLRRTIYFSNPSNNKPFIKSSYTSRTFLFSGLAVDEVLLIRAECLARSGNKTGALTDLNTLLQNRWKKNTFVAYTDNTVTDPLPLILTERRKELPFRNVRWTDLRRLNKEGMNIELKRMVNGLAYELLPNSSHYVLPLPPDVIAQSNMPQNPR